MRSNPIQTRPKRGIEVTYGRGGVRRSSGRRRWRGLEHRSDELRQRRWVLELDRGGEREKTGLSWSFIGGWGYGVEGRERGARIGYLPCRCGGPAASIQACAITGTEEGKHAKEKGREGGALTCGPRVTARGKESQWPCGCDAEGRARVGEGPKRAACLSGPMRGKPGARGAVLVGAEGRCGQTGSQLGR